MTIATTAHDPVLRWHSSQPFPFVNVTLIAANFAVFLFYELPDLDEAISRASFYPCCVENACSTTEPWGVGWITCGQREQGLTGLR
jgi:hypothetical protein